jgi:ribonucleotide reductase alpha subunit
LSEEDRKMSLFNDFGGGFIGSPKSGRLFKKGPSISEKIDMLFTDVETEGKKQGYKRAASKYEKAFKEIEYEYNKTKELIESQKSNYGNESEKLIEKLSELEKQKKLLEKQFEKRTKDFSSKYDIPIGDVSKFASTGTLMCTTFTVSILDLIYSYKEKKLRKAEQRGYIEARELYEEKIAKLKQDLQDLKKKGNADIKNLLYMIDDLFNAIADEQMKIADLKILL